MKRNHSAGLFLMEMIIVILFFSICAGICIQVFAKADQMSRKASNLNHAVVRAESIAEEIRSGSGKADGQTYDTYWDSDWKETADPSRAEYSSRIILSTDQDHMETADIRILKGEEILFSMTADHYLKP